MRISGGNMAAVLTMRFANDPASKFVPRLQILIYPLLQLFDLMLPSYLQPYYKFFPYTVDYTLSIFLKKKIDPSIYGNNHTTVAQKKHYRKYVDWSLIPAKYRTVYKKPITDDNEGDSTLIENAKQALLPEISPLLVEDEKLAKLPSTYLLTVGHDSLRDEAFMYEGRLKRVGVSVAHDHYENIFHAALNFLYGPFALDIAREMMGGVVKYVKANL